MAAARRRGRAARLTSLKRFTMPRHNRENNDHIARSNVTVPRNCDLALSGALRRSANSPCTASWPRPVGRKRRKKNRSHLCGLAWQRLASAGHRERQALTPSLCGHDSAGFVLFRCNASSGVSRFSGNTPAPPADLSAECDRGQQTAVIWTRQLHIIYMYAVCIRRVLIDYALCKGLIC